MIIYLFLLLNLFLMFNLFISFMDTKPQYLENIPWEMNHSQTLIEIRRKINIYLDNCEKILNKITVEYNKMNLMLKPKIHVASYNCVYYFSLGQIKYNKYLRPYIDQLFEKFLSYIGYNEQPHFTPELNYAFYKNGSIIQTGKPFVDILEPKDYDLFMVNKTDYDLKRNIYFTNYICSNKIVKEHQFIESSVKFLNAILNYNGIEYEIKFKNNEYVHTNYYIVNNIIDKAFFMYYLSSYHIPHNIDFTTFNYTLHLLDHNVNSVVLDETHGIIIKQDDYEIVTLTNKQKQITINNEPSVNNNENKSDTLSDNFEDDFDKLE
jgi:hypothetical protein